MTDTREYLIGEIGKRKAQAEEILDTASKAGRDPTADEQSEIKGLLTRIEEHTVEVKRIDDRDAMKAQLDNLGAVTELAVQEPTVEVKARNLGEAFTGSAEYKAIVTEYKRTGSMPKFDMPPIELKAAGDAVLTSDGQNVSAIQPGWDPTLYTPGLVQLPLTVRALLGQSQASSNVVHYPIVATRTGPEGNPTAEGAAKKGVIFAFDDGTVTLEKNTAFGGASDEMFQDAPVLTSYMTNQIGLMVDQVEEAAITTVLYAAASTVTGSGISAGPLGFDAIREAIMTVRVNGGVPDGVLIHPSDAAFLDVIRAVAGDGDYFSGGPFGAPRNNVWGSLRYVESAAADPGRPLVGAFRVGSTLYTRGGTTVETSNSHDDYFEKDKVAIRAWRRSKAVKHYPEWFVQCDIGAS